MSRKIRTSKKLWSNDQWAVTTYGLEVWRHRWPYFIPKHRLLELDWGEHVGQKSWCNKEAFAEAYEKALEIFGLDILRKQARTKRG